MKQITPGQLVKYLGPLFRACTKPLKLLCHEKVKYINNNRYVEIKHNFSWISYVSVGTRGGQLKVNKKITRKIIKIIWLDYTKQIIILHDNNNELIIIEHLLGVR